MEKQCNDDDSDENVNGEDDFIIDRSTLVWKLLQRQCGGKTTKE